MIIPELRVLVLTKRHVGSGNEIGILLFEMDFPSVVRFPVPLDKGNDCSRDEIGT